MENTSRMPGERPVKNIMNFWKIVKSSFQYRWNIFFCIITALGVGVLWGTNLSAVFPFMQITFKGQTMQEWAADCVKESELQIQALETRRAVLLTNAPTPAETSTPAETPTPESAPTLPEMSSAEEVQELPEDVQALTDIALIDHKLQIERATHGGYVKLKEIIDAWLPTTPFSTIVLLLAALLAMTVLKTAFLIANSVLVSRIANLTILNIRNRLFDKCLALEFARYTQDGSAVLMSRITNDVGGIGGGLADVYGKMIREPLKMFVCMGIAIWINWQLFVVTILILPLIAWAIQKLARKIRQTSRQIMKEVAKLFETLQETFFGIKIVKCFTLEEHVRERFFSQGRTIYGKALKVSFLDALAKGLVECSGILLVSIALLVGAWLVLTGNTTLFGFPMSERPLSIEWLVMFYVALLGAADPARKLSDIFTSIQNAIAVADRVYELIDTPVKVADPENPVSLDGNSMDLEFRNVDFDYTPDRPVLRGVNLTIPHGKTVAIVGANGCGKSTLLNLIPRLADPTSGEVLLGGVSLRDMKQKDLHSRLGLVSQDAILFDDTIYENIRFGRFDATKEEVIAAAKLANAHEFIENTLPQGYETPIGPLGNLLSGGQRQRIALARVILRDPKILLLDEATSQIDLESERAIQESLSIFHKNRTVVIVTHRLGILALADEIVVMENGRIIDQGTHEELMDRCGFYRNLYQDQPAGV